MIRTLKAATAILAALLLTGVARPEAKHKVKVGFIGPLTGGVSGNGLGGRNSADLAVRLRNADAKAKYEYELVVLDDECKADAAVQVATKMAEDRDVYHKLGLPVVVGVRCCPTLPTATNMPRCIAFAAR
jgi:branched-chain amino acid transport system substrate-binding protein